MTKLTKTHLKERDELTGKLRDRRDDLMAALEKYNQAISDAFKGGLKPAIDAYNEELSAARHWADNIATEMGDYYDGKSEKWQEDDKGQSFYAWKEQFEEFSQFNVESIDIQEPEALDIDAEDVSEIIDQLPEEPE